MTVGLCLLTCNEMEGCGAFSLELLKQAPFPDGMASLGEDGIRRTRHDAGLRGRGYSGAGEILRYAKTSAGIKDGAVAGRTAVKWFVQRIQELDAELGWRRKVDFEGLVRMMVDAEIYRF